MFKKSAAVKVIDTLIKGKLELYKILMENINYLIKPLRTSLRGYFLYTNK